jgi:uncharacterized protein YqgC (DUF456 family)
MDLFLVILGFVLILVGIAGSVLPVLPGPLMGWFGLLSLYLSSWVEMNYYVLVITFILSLGIFILDYLIPSMGAKRFGGSKKGATGATIGLVVGLFLPIPLGFVIGAFVGAFIGEIIHKKDDLRRAWRSAIGSFLGFLTSTGLKLVLSLFFFVFYIYLVSSNWPSSF